MVHAGGGADDGMGSGVDAVVIIVVVVVGLGFVIVGVSRRRKPCGSVVKGC